MENEIVINSRIWRKAEQKNGILLLDLMQEIEEEDGDAAVVFFWELHSQASGQPSDFEQLEALLH